MTDRNHSGAALSRRDLIRVTGTAVLVAAAGSMTWAGSAHATAESADAVMSKLIGGRATKAGRVTLKLPQIAENGNTVPFTVEVDSPMTDADYVKAIHVVADGNPRPDVASFFLTPASGRAEVTTRIRMAKTQNIIAVAEMSDGSLYKAVQNVKVTIGGCGG